MNSINIQNLPVKQQPDFYVFNDETNQKNTTKILKNH